MAASDTFRLSEREKTDIAELVAYLRRIPSRHRHILAALDFKFYTALVKLEGEAKALADEVEASAKRH
jgi:hypothetical protein